MARPKQPKKPDATSELTCITPAMAAEWLTKNDEENRNINLNRVAALQHDIEAGNWKLTPDAITFGKGGKLVNGQHRLSAIVAAKASVWAWVAFDKNATIQDPIDQGLGRSIAFVAGISSREAATYAWLSRLECGALYSKQRVTSADTIHLREVYGVTYEQLRVNINLTHVSGALVAACIWLLAIDEAKTVDFLSKVVTGEMIRRGDPAYAFRNWHRGGRLTGAEVVLGACNALRHHIQSKPLKSIYTGEMGYRATCAKRRALKVERTPGTDLVVGVSWPTSERPEREVAEVTE